MRGGYYVIKITMNSGEKRYVRFLEGSFRPSVIVSRSEATRFDNRRVAEICSEYFWENHWIREDYYSRETLYVPQAGSRG